MRNLRIVVSTPLLMPGASLAQAQVLATQRAGFNLSPGQVAAPNTPGGGVVIGRNFIHRRRRTRLPPLEGSGPRQSRSINSGILAFDTTLGFSLGGGGLCLPFCQVGQIAYTPTRLPTSLSMTTKKGNGAGFPGVWRVSVNPASGRLSVEAQLVPKAGLAGNNPTGIAFRDRASGVYRPNPNAATLPSGPEGQSQPCSFD